MNDDRADRIETLLKNNTLLRKNWGDGKETACLLAALVPEIGQGDYSKCPAEVMPEWLARLTPWMNDSGSLEKWPSMVKRYAAIARQWHVLSPEDWRRLDYRIRAICVREAASHMKKKDVVAVCNTVILLCDRAGRGEMVTAEEWIAARTAAGAMESLWWSVKMAGASKVARAATVAWAAAEEVAWAAAAEVAWAAEASTDRLTSLILDEIEKTCIEKDTT